MTTAPSFPDAAPESLPAQSSSPHHKMSARQRFLFFLTAWLIVLMPFLFWWNTWFGRRLSISQLTEYLQDTRHPRHIQHALVQIGERMSHRDAAARLLYPQLTLLASHPVEEVRNTDAWVMCQDPTGAGFHETLLKMLHDSSPLVRGNAALSLVRFGDVSGGPQIVALLQPTRIRAPVAGRVFDADRPGTAIHQGGLIAELQLPKSSSAQPDTPAASQMIEVRSPISGRIRSLSVSIGATVAAGAEIATVDPGDDQVWEALRALYLIGTAEDLPAIRPFERESAGVSDRVRQQALLTDQAIRSRASVRP